MSNKQSKNRNKGKQKKDWNNEQVRRNWLNNPSSRGQKLPWNNSITYDGTNLDQCLKAPKLGQQNQKNPDQQKHQQSKENYLKFVRYQGMDDGQTKKINDRIMKLQRIYEGNDLKDENNTVIEYELEKEARSTAFILRCLANTMIPEPGLEFKFEAGDKLDETLKGLTGVWVKDFRHFKIVRKDSMKSRLIYGLGPNEPGKRDVIIRILKLLSKTNKITSNFVSLDEEAYKKCSTILDIVKKDLGFPFEKIKEKVIEYLKTINEPIPLYISENLEKCPEEKKNGITKNCLYISNTLMKIAHDKEPMGFLVYQHRESDKCTKKDSYKCQGYAGITEENYNQSLTNSKKKLEKLSVKYKIHNSGPKIGKLVITDYNFGNEFTDILKKSDISMDYKYESRYGGSGYRSSIYNTIPDPLIFDKIILKT